MVTTKAGYAVPANADHVGDVRQRETRTIILDINANGVNDDQNAEYAIYLNGRLLRRMTNYQAKRFGILRDY